MSNVEGYTEEQFDELFQFLLPTNRPDVKKMAASGLSQLSKDNAELNKYLKTNSTAISTLSALLSLSDKSNINLIGDVLTVLINCSTDAGISEVLSCSNLVKYAMRFLELIEQQYSSSSSSEGENKNKVIENSPFSPNVISALKEMTLMLINNLTASNVVAVKDLLQADDEDLAGYYLAKLHAFYVADDCQINKKIEEEKNIKEEEKEVNKKVKKEEDGERGENIAKNSETQNATDQRLIRDVRKWYLQICLNVTCTPTGQKFLLAEDWLSTLAGVVSDSQVPTLRYLALQIFNNCSSSPENHKRIIDSGVLPKSIERIHKVKEAPEIQKVITELIVGMLQSEQGMTALEEINAKKYLMELVSSSDGNNEGKVDQKVLPVLQEEEKKFIQKNILPFLDDITDAYMMEN